MSHRNRGNHRKLLAAPVNGLASLAGADGVMFSAAGMPQLLILQPLLWVVPLITTSSRPRLSSAFRFKRRQGAAGAGNSPSVSEGVAEGRGSNMSVKIPCAWLAALAGIGSVRGGGCFL